MGFYGGKKVLVAGGTGLIGRYLVDKLIEEDAKVRITSLDNPILAHPKSEFLRLDLTKEDNCMKACNGMDFAFNLLCIKGSPKTMKEKPASVFTSMILFNTNLLEAARKCDVKKYLYTSTIGVYHPAEVFYEEDVWKTFPSDNDRFAGWVKRIGELQTEAYKIQYNWKDISIVRPANTYGLYDNFNSINAMVIPSLIKRAIDGENPFVVWGDGSSVRDFVHAKDVAEGMMLAMEKNPGPEYPINLGSGKRYSIKNLVDIIINNLEKKPEIIYDTSKPRGDEIRIMDISRAKSLLDWEPKISLEEGVKGLMDWYKKNRDSFSEERYNIFNKEPK